MCKLISLAAAAALLLAAIASPAQARGGSDIRDCSKAGTDTQISACTRILDAARLSADERVIALNNRALAYVRKSDYDRAIRDLDEALSIKPRAFQLHRGRAQASYLKGEHAEAIRSYDEAISLQPKDVDLYNERSIVFFVMKEYDKAINDCDKAILLEPRNGVHFLNRADSYAAKGDLDRAFRDLNEAVRLAPKEPSPLANRATLFAAKGDFARALADLGEAIRLKPNSPEFLNSRGFIYKQQGDYDRAIRDLDEAIRLNPKLPEAFSNRGDAWRRRGEFDRAIADLSEAVRLHPAMTPAYVNRGLTHEAKGDIEKARADFNAALTRGPGVFTTGPEAVAKARERLAALGDGPSAAPPAPAQVAARSEPRADASERGPRLALVIGNAAYSNVTSLANPVNDAREMSSVLRDLGFKVIEGYNLNSVTMRGKIAEFGAALPGAGVSLFYYAGHGMQVAGKNYLMPVDARLERPSSLSIEAIEVNTVIADMEAEKRINLVFLDACRDNPLSRTLARSMGTGARAVTVGQGLAQVNAGIGTLITFATSPDTIALDGSGRNSPFTLAMLKHIRTPGLEIRTMLTRVRADVIKATNEQQVPWDHSSLTGEFYFKPGS